LVQDGYEDHWARYERHLNEAKSLDEWLCIPGMDDVPRHHNFEGRVRKAAFDVYTFQMECVFRAIERYFPKARSITEYGCGVGRNLLHVKRKYPDWTCFGYELAPAGVRIAQAAARKFGMDDIRYTSLDYVNDRKDAFVFPETDLALTVFSLEQVPYTNMIGVKNMLDRSRLGTIHLEPVPENYPYSYRGVLGRVFSQRVDYLKNFDAGVRALKLTGVHKEVLNTSHNPVMFPSLYVLEK
jgi:hypothetical protein